MKITRIIFKKPDIGKKPLALCDVVLEDCLRVTDIRLYSKEGSFYLVLPSKQDIYQNIDSMNEGKEIQYPGSLGINGGRYEEFYYPVKKDFYYQLLEAIKEGYFKRLDNEDIWSYVPECSR